MKGRLKVKVLLVQNFSQQIVCLDFELIANVIEVSGFHELTELLQHICAPSWVKSLFWHLKTLKLSEKIVELFEAGQIVNINIKNCL